MNIGRKSQVLLAFLVAFSCIVILGVVFLLSMISYENGSNGENNNNNQDQGNVNKIPVEKNPNVTPSTELIVITKDDTIISQELGGESENLNLNQYSWKDLKLSNNKQYVSVLGKENDNSVYNIFVYNFANRQWNKVTNFSTLTGGILSYTWQQNVIFFNQGSGLNNWLHRFKPQSGELIKVKPINGDILKTSIDNKYLLYFMNQKFFSIYDNEGNLVWEMKSIKDANNNDINIQDVLFTSLFEKLILVDNSNEIYKVIIRENTAAKIFTSNRPLNLTPICDITDNILRGIAVTDSESANKIEKYFLNVLIEQITKDAENTIVDDRIIKSKISCYGTTLLLGTEKNEWLVWQQNTEILKVNSIKDAKEVVIKI